MRKKQLILPIVISLLIILSFITLNSVYADTINVMEVSSNGIQEYLNKPANWHYHGTYNRTYFSYISNTGGIKVRYYDHDTDSFGSEKQIVDRASDDHHDPTILINGTGYIFIFEVNAVAGSHSGDILLWRSSNPEDISSFESAITVDDNSGNTYPKPWIMNNGTIGVSWRGDDKETGITYSEDNGTTWDTWSILSDDATYSQLYSEQDNPNYLHYNTIDPQYPGGCRQDIYYMYSDDGGYTWYDSDDTPVTLPADYTQMTKTWECDCGRMLDIYSNSSHNAHILANDDIDNANGTVPLYHIWYDGSSWHNEQLPVWQDVFRLVGDDHAYTGGACFDRDDWRVVYTTYENGTDDDADVKVIFYNETSGNWEHGADVTTGGSNCKVRPMPVRFSCSEIAFTFADGTYDSYTNYNTDLNCGSQFIIGGGSPPTPDDETQFQTINDKTNNSVICTPSRYFNWSKIDDVNLECYDLQIANDSGFSSVFVNLTDVNETNYGINYTEKGNYVEFILPYAYNISYYGEHHYRVRARYYGS